jgi:hypothetical protein
MVTVNCAQAGIMEEMMDDALDVQEEDEIEEEANAEVDKVLFELTNGKLGEAGSVGTELPVRLSPSGGIDSWLKGFADIASKARRGRDRENDGTISATTEWFAERMTKFRGLYALVPHMHAYTHEK